MFLNPKTCVYIWSYPVKDYEKNKNPE